jgi:ribosomal-protein-alanine N-acetyltransferase
MNNISSGIENILIKDVKNFDLNFVLEIKKLEIENLGKISGINEWVIPVIIKYGKLIIAVKNDKNPNNNKENLIVGVNELIRDWNDINCAFIHSFYIKEGYRNQGIGTILLKESIEILKKENIKKIELTVDPKNYAAIKLYEKFGFKRIAFIKDLYGKNINRNIMACEI